MTERSDLGSKSTVVASGSAARPPGIECKDWEAGPQGGKRCRYFVAGGACSLPRRFMCEEWERANPHLATLTKRAEPEAPSALSLLVPPPERSTRAEPNVSPDGDLVLTNPEKGPPKAREAARRAFVAAFPQAAGVVVEAAPFEPAKDIPAENLEALERAGSEFTLDVDPNVSRDPIVLVPRRTGKPRRFELTFREAATLRLIVDAFPGARLVKLTKADDPETTPEGYVNNCALRNGADEEECQVCAGTCPDKARLVKEAIVSMETRNAQTPTSLPPWPASANARSAGPQSSNGAASVPPVEPDPFEL